MPDARCRPQAARTDAQPSIAAAAELAQVAPQRGSYVSESNYFNPRLAARLLGRALCEAAAVKAKYDPDGLFFVHHGVGSEEWSADGFTRVS